MITLANDITNVTTSEASTFIEKLASMISEYGPLIVIMAVFLFVFVAAVLAIMHMNNKMIISAINERNTMINSITGQNDKLVDCIAHRDDKDTESTHEEEAQDKEAPIIIKNSADKRDLIGTYIDINIILKDASRNALEDLDCERIAIYVFHNGNKSIHGLPFFKMSCVHEWCKTGSRAMKTKTIRGISHVDMPLYTFSSIVEDIYEHGKYVVEDVNNLCKRDEHLQTFLAYSDAKSVYAVAIVDDDGNVAGFILAEFSEKKNFKECGKEVEDILETMNECIRPVILNTRELKKES